MSCKAELLSVPQNILFSSIPYNNFKSVDFKNINSSSDKSGLFIQKGFLNSYFVLDVVLSAKDVIVNNNTNQPSNEWRRMINHHNNIKQSKQDEDIRLENRRLLLYIDWSREIFLINFHWTET